MIYNRFCFKIFVLVSLISGAGVNEACTVFCITEPGEYMVLGKNLDWPVGEGYIFINKKGVARTSYAKSGEKSVHWISMYGSITFNMFGKNFPLGGMNETGLVVEETSYSPSIYPPAGDNPSITEMQWIQYQLDNHCQVAEVIESLSELDVSCVFTGLHYFVCDRSGSSAVIEFINGNVLIYTGTALSIPVLSNNSYSNSLKYIRKHQGFGGVRIVSNGPESPERFVRAAGLVKQYGVEHEIDPVTYAHGILKNVRQADTQWSIVYNLKALQISFAIKRNDHISTIDLHEMDFSCGDAEVFQLADHGYTGALRRRNFQIYDLHADMLYLHSLFQKMADSDILETEEAQLLRDRLIRYAEISRQNGEFQ